jgi:hypothetical protein
MPGQYCHYDSDSADTSETTICGYCGFNKLVLYFIATNSEPEPLSVGTCPVCHKTMRKYSRNYKADGAGKEEGK